MQSLRRSLTFSVARQKLWCERSACRLLRHSLRSITDVSLVPHSTASEIREASEHGEPASQQPQRSVLRLHPVRDPHRRQQRDPRRQESRPGQSAGEEGRKGAGVSHKHTVKSDTTHRRAAVTVALDKRLVSIFFSSTFSGFCGQTVCRCSGLRNTRVVSSRGEGKFNFDLLSLGDRKMLGR